MHSYLLVNSGKKLVVFISAPALVEAVLSDKETFPTRGPNGFSRGILNTGLVALPTGKQWQQHRRVYSKFLTERYLTDFSVEVQEEIEVLLTKWRDIGGRAAVNAQYDLSCLTEDIIGRIALGVNLGRQAVAEEDNDEARDRDTMMKEVMLRTMPKTVGWFYRSGASAQDVRRIQGEAKGKLSSLVEQTMELGGTNMISVMKRIQVKGVRLKLPTPTSPHCTPVHPMLTLTPPCTP
jgi:cytochrome P450